MRNARTTTLLALLASLLISLPALAFDKQAAYDEMLALGQQIRELKPRAASDTGAAAQLDAALARYRDLSAALGGDDPASTLEAPAAPAGPQVAPPLPPGCAPIVVNAANNTPTPIPDNSVVQSTLVVGGAGNFLLDVDLSTFITHTFSGDLDVTLESPAGTIVKITTDNGSLNDNVFNGTLWDDQAGDPVTDHVYANNVVATPLTVEEALGMFLGEDPNGTWTLTVADDATIDTGTLNSWSLAVTSIAAAPATTWWPPVANNTPTPIPDNGSVQSVINIVSSNYLLEAELQTTITHTFSGDLDITLQSPAGTVEVVTTDNGGSNDNVFNGTYWRDTANEGPVDHVYVNNVVATPLDLEGAMARFTGQNPNGNWTLTVADDATIDTGTLNSWSLTLRTAEACGCQLDLTCPGDVAVPAPPGAQSQIVTFADPVVGGTCTNVTTSCSPASGDAFPVGDTLVVSTAVDGGTGTQASCDFTVSVGTQPIQEIPTASTLGLAALALLLGGAAFVALRRG